MIIKTERPWNLHVKKVSGKCIEVRENHDGDTPLFDQPYVIIPFEAIPTLIEFLEKHNPDHLYCIRCNKLAPDCECK